MLASLLRLCSRPGDSFSGLKIFCGLSSPRLDVAFPSEGHHGVNDCHAVFLRAHIFVPQPKQWPRLQLGPERPQSDHGVATKAWE